jgi:V8-like Glu-specific endopeptidase
VVRLVTVRRSFVRRLITAAVLVTALSSVSSASAITDGTADGQGHPNVGGLVAPTQYSDGTWIYCSGTLISPTVFLTAAHCADVSDRVRVTFDTAYVDGDKTYSGTFHGDPLYNKSQSDPHDIAVVVLDRAVRGITPARLPAANSLSKLSGSQQFTSVGYGAYEVTNGPGGHQYLYNDVRGVATGTLNTITQSWLKISMNPSHGDGGTCYGDSGGPNFLGTTNIVAAITITGDAVCRSTNVDYRIDTRSARSFLSQYVALP